MDSLDRRRVGYHTGDVDIADSFDVGTDEETSAREELRRATEAQFSPQEVAWEKRFRCGPSAMLAEEFQQWVDQGVSTAQSEGNYDTFPCGMLPMEDGLLIYGATGTSSYLDGFAIKTDPAGNPQWERHYGAGGKDLDYITGARLAPDGSLLLLGTSGSYSSYAGGKRAYLVKTSADGAAQWEVFWGEGTSYPEPHAAVAGPDGSFTVYGIVQQEPCTIFVLQLDGAGKIVAEHSIDARQEIGDTGFAGLEASEDGGFAVTGEIAEPDQFKNLLLAKYDSEAKLQWKRSIGGPKLERGQAVVQTADGGFLAAGYLDEFDSAARPYLVRVDAQGELVWQKAVGGGGTYEVRHLQATPDGGLLLTGVHRPTEESLPLLLVLRADATGEVIWEKHLAQPEVVYAGVSSMENPQGRTLVLATRTWGNQDLDATSLIQLVEVDHSGKQ